MALGIGQQPYFPLGSSQQVELSGHRECPSGHVTEVGRAINATGLLVLRAGIFLARGWVPVAMMQRVWARSQTAPWGQQCTLSSQQEASGMGQHPQEPSTMTQHVEESGHSNWLPGHWTAPTEVVSDCWKQVRPSALQWKPRGQQWRPSPHDTASGNGQQLEVPEIVRTQEWP